MSMMMRRGPAAQTTGQPGRQPELASDPRFPEVAGVIPTVWPTAEVRARLEGFAQQRFNGYLVIKRQIKFSGPEGYILLHLGQPIVARAGALDGQAALVQLLARDTTPEIVCATHALAEDVVLALSATFHTPQLTQPMSKDGGEIALLLRELASVSHSGTVQIAAAGARGMLWVRILMNQGNFLGVFSGSDRQLKPSLAEVMQVLAESDPELALYSSTEALPPIPLPAPPVKQRVSPVPGGSAERDELLETDLVWFMSRFERAFTRLRERREPQADLLRAFGELTNELGGFVSALQEDNPKAQGGGSVVITLLHQARMSGQVLIDLRTGRAGLDAAGIARVYNSFPKRSEPGIAYFLTASNDMLLLIERLMERMLAAFHDPATAVFSREGCETLLREVRSGLADLARR